MEGIKEIIYRMIHRNKKPLTGNTDLLAYFASFVGAVLVKVPNYSAKKIDEFTLLDEYQKATLDATHKLKNFFDSPNKDNYAAVDIALQKVMELTVRADKYAKKAISGQLEMFEAAN